MTDTRWDRRQFLARSAAAAAALSSSRVQLLAQSTQSPPATAATTSPGVITGGIQPLLEGQTARPLRYRPDGSDVIAHNGNLFFNRPVYGTISSFRIDAGDLPEFSLYLPGHGGNLKLGIITTGSAKWFAQAADIIARYRPGRMIYELRDPTLGSGFIHIEILTAAEGSTMMLELRAQNIPAGLTLAWAFAGASGRKGDRNGDIGCEKQPITQFFQSAQKSARTTSSPSKYTPANSTVPQATCSSPSLLHRNWPSQISANGPPYPLRPAARLQTHSSPSSPAPCRSLAKHRSTSAFNTQPRRNPPSTSI